MSKQMFIKVGETYLFDKTIVSHRKHLEGKPFMVVARKVNGMKLTSSPFGSVSVKRNWRFINENGDTANAGELKELNSK